MSNYIEITEAATDAGSPIDTDLMRGTAGSDPNGGVRGNLRNLDARVTTLEGGGGGGGGAAGIDVEEKFTELRKTLSDNVVDKSPNNLTESFFNERPYFNYRLMRAVSASDTVLYIAPNPRTIEGGSASTNLNFIYTGFTWAALAGTDASSVAADATNKLIGTESVSWSKAGGTSTLSIIQRDVGTTLAWGISAYKKIVCFARIDTITNLTNFLVRISAAATTGTDYAEWRVTTQQLGGGFINSATGIGWNILVFDLSATPDATGGAGFNPNTQTARTWAFGTTVSSSGQTHNVNVDSFWHVPHTGSGIAAVYPEVDQLSQIGDTIILVDNSNKELKTIDVSGASSNPSVIGQQDVSAGFTNAFSGGSSTTIRRATLNTGSVEAQFESTDAELTSGVSENDQSVIIKTVLADAASNDAFDFSIDFRTNLYFYVKSKPTATTFKVDSTVDLSAEMLSSDTFRLYNVYWADGKAHFSEITSTTGQVTLTANSSYSASEITFTVSSGDNAKVSVGMLAIKENEVKQAISIASATANDSGLETYLTPNSRPLSDIGLVYPQSNLIAAHYLLGAQTQAEAIRNRKRTTGVVGNLQLNAGGPGSYTAEFKNGQLAASNFGTTGQSFYLDAALTASESIGMDTTGPWTYSVWIKDKDKSTSYFYPISESNAINNGVYIGRGAFGNMFVTIMSGASHTHTEPHAEDEWFHYVIKRNNTDWAHYVNGVKYTFTSTSVASGNNLIFGGFNASVANGFQYGEMADLVIWKKDLTDEEVLAIYNNGAHVPLGSTPGGMKYVYNLTGKTGQKVVSHTRLVRNTNTHQTAIRKITGVKS